MIPTLFFYELVLVALAWLFLMLWWLWPNDPRHSLPDPTPTYATTQALPRSHPVCRAGPQASLCPVCTSNHASPSTTAVASQPQASHQPTPPCGRHVEALLSLDGLSVSRLVGGWASGAPMAILTAAPGDHASVPRARAMFPSIMARSFMASKWRWS